MKNPAHAEQLKDHGIKAIDMGLVSFYPCKQTLANAGVSGSQIRENIDVGGPTTLRAAAKNFSNVAVVVDPADYEQVLADIKQHECDEAKRKQLAAKVFRHTAHYDAMIASYFSEQTDEIFPETYSVTYEKVQTLRYGENPHQQAAFYREPQHVAMSLAAAKQLHGKELSFNNIQDANAALEIVSEYDGPTAVAVKHMNPCGIDSSKKLADAFPKANTYASTAMLGGIVTCNRKSIVTQHSN